MREASPRRRPAAGRPQPAAPEEMTPVRFGWRPAAGVTLTREEAREAWNTPWGPCARCGVRHRRYGEGGGPLCSACREPGAVRGEAA